MKVWEGCLAWTKNSGLMGKLLEWGKMEILGCYSRPQLHA